MNLRLQEQECLLGDCCLSSAEGSQAAKACEIKGCGDALKILEGEILGDFKGFGAGTSAVERGGLEDAQHQRLFGGERALCLLASLRELEQQAGVIVVHGVASQQLNRL